ncbi:MAG: hypothetical protein ACKPFA_33295, partial [Dolichospermum sp.]
SCQLFVVSCQLSVVSCQLFVVSCQFIIGSEHFCCQNMLRGRAANSAHASLCLEVNNLESAISYLTSLGYPPLGIIYTASHGKEIYAYDPDGNRLILHQSN